MTADSGTVTLSVASREETVARMDAAMRGKAQGSYITFPTVELLWKVVTSKRLAILRAMTGGEIISIREVARRVGRDVKAVHADVRALVNAGLVEDTGSGVRFGYDAVRVEFTLKAA